MPFCVVWTNGEVTGVNGPYPRRQTARAAAANMAEGLAGDDRHLIDASPDGNQVVVGETQTLTVCPISRPYRRGAAL